MRRLAVVLAGVLLVLGGFAVLQLVLSSRDDAGIGNAPAGGPGQLQRDLGSRHLAAGQHIPLEGLTDPPTSGAHHPRLPMRDEAVLSPDQILHSLELGDVILFYGESRPPEALKTLQSDVSGPFDPEVAAAGQQVILARRARGGSTRGVTAAAWRRLLRTADASDPQLREFAEAWIGRGVRG